MTGPTIGVDCDVTFTHPDVNDGDPYGFILAYDPSVQGSAISIQRQVDTTTLEVSIRLFLTVVLADDLKNPDGSEHSDSRAFMYLKLLDYLSQTDGLAVNTVMGTFTGIAPVGYSATELHQPEVSNIACQFTNISEYHDPITSADFYLSEWDGDLTWATSYWR